MVEALFLNAVLALGGQRDVDAAYARLDAAYRAPSRSYHNLRHIERALETYLWLGEGLDPATSSKIVLALVYHDAVYDPRSKENEEASAAMARDELAALGVEGLDEVERLILLTKDHRVFPHDVAGALVVDADLAILQAPPGAYDAYAEAIRWEYSFVPDEEYRVGRTRVLESLMKRRLFVSPKLDEAAARANMGREMVRLAG